MSMTSPLRFPCGQQSHNRFLLAPMTNKQSGEDGKVSNAEIAWLEARARGGFGTVITCASHVVPEGKGFDGQMGIFSDELLPGLQRLAARLKAAGSLSIVQLYHGGVMSPKRLTGVEALSASSIVPGELHPEGAREIREDEIEHVIEAFAAAAVRAATAGFSGIEVHGAHGYLITQFIDSFTNKRTDRWGGPLEHRARFLLEIVRRIRARVPQDFILGVRLSPEAYRPGQGLLLEETLHINRWLDELKVDYLHMSLGDVFRKPHGAGEDSLSTLEILAQQNYKAPLIVAGGITQRADAERALSLGADGLAIGRIAIGHAAWVKLITTGQQAVQTPPFSEAHLREQALDPRFIEYMRRWPGFVSP